MISMDDANDRTTLTKTLATLPYFGELAPDLLEEVASQAVPQRYEPEQVVFLDGEPSPGLCLVSRGWLKASRITESGREHVVRVLGPGETFSELSLFVETPSMATVVALEPTTVWLIRRAAALDLMERHPPLMRALTQTLARRVLYLLAVVEDLSLRSVEARLARYVLDHADQGVLHRRRWHTQAELAARLATVPDVLGRALQRLSEQGFVKVDRRRIVITDTDGLVAHAERRR